MACSPLPPLFWEDFRVGTMFETPGRTVTEADVVGFAGLSGDYNQLHVDEEFSKTGPFERRVAHGALTLSILTGLWDRIGIIAGSAVAFSGIDKLRFTKPVYPGDTVKATIEVAAKEEGSPHGLVVLSNKVTNQRGEVVLVCDARIIIRKRPPKR